MTEPEVVPAHLVRGHVSVHGRFFANLVRKQAVVSDAGVRVFCPCGSGTSRMFEDGLLGPAVASTPTEADELRGEGFVGLYMPVHPINDLPFPANHPRSLKDLVTCHLNFSNPAVQITDHTIWLAQAAVEAALMDAELFFEFAEWVNGNRPLRILEAMPNAVVAELCEKGVTAIPEAYLIRMVLSPEWMSQVWDALNSLPHFWQARCKVRFPPKVRTAP